MNKQTDNGKPDRDQPAPGRPSVSSRRRSGGTRGSAEGSGDREKSRPSRKTFRARLDAMVEAVRGGILDGTYAPGDYLPSEETLAGRFQLSGKSVRKGLDRLVQEGWIVKERRIGSRVTDKAKRTVVQLTLGYSPSIPRDLALERLLQAFHERYPHIRVKTVMLPHPSRPAAMKEYLQSAIVDVISLNNSAFRELADGGYAELLEELPERADHYPLLNRLFKQGDKLRVQPMAFSPLVLCYNRAHFREAGMPEPDGGWTWDDVIRSAKALSIEEQRYGLYFHLPSINRWPVFLLQNGVRFSRAGTDEGRGVFAEDRFLQSVRLLRNIASSRGLLPPMFADPSGDAEHLFAEGKVSMIIHTYFSLNPLNNSALDYDISPLPFMTEPKTLMIAIGMAVNRHSRQKEAAKRLVEFFASEEAQLLIRQETLSIPGLKAAAEREVVTGLNRPSRYSLFRETIGTFRTHDEMGLSGAGLEEMGNSLKLYWTGAVSEESLLERVRMLLRAEVVKRSPE